MRLHSIAERAAARGAVVIISNVDCAEVRQLYANKFMVPLNRAKAIGNAVKSSGSQHELLIVYDDPAWYRTWNTAANQKSAVDPFETCSERNKPWEGLLSNASKQSSFEFEI